MCRQGLKNAQLQEPKIENNASGTLLTIYRNAGGDGTVNGTVMSETNVGNMSETKLAERQTFIVAAIKSNPSVTGKRLSETQRTIERDLSVLQKLGIIRHEGNVNAGIWLVLK